jgi:hypothetical protein
LFPACPVAQCLQSHVPVVFSSHESCDRSTRRFWVCRVQRIIIQLYIGSRIIAWRKVGINIAQIFVSASAARADDRVLLIGRKWPDKVFQRIRFIASIGLTCGCSSRWSSVGARGSFSRGAAGFV